MALAKHKGRKILVLAVAASVTLSGCGLTPQKAETEPETSQGPIALETEALTEAPTEAPTETEKKEVPLKDIQVSVEKTGRTGTASLQIDDTNGSTDISQSFRTTSSAYQSSSDDGSSGVYAGKDGVLYELDGVWKDTGEKYQGLFSLVYGDDCEKLEDTAINGTACYHLSAYCDDPASALLAYCWAAGYTDVIGGSTQADFYIAEDTFEIVRLDVSMAFAGTSADGTDTKGEIYGSISVSGTSSEALTVPEAAVEETEAVDTYAKGEILSEKNGFTNQQFGIQILGGSLLTFDATKTQELNDTYTSSGSAYTEEAYGSGDGVILNISSVLSKGSSTEGVLSRYMSDSAAENIVTGENVTFAGRAYATVTASINQTLTKTYGTGVDGRVLIITLYYTDEASVEQFERNIYSTSEDPYWEATSWTLESKYQVTTPNGYSIVTSESNDLYVCMSSSSDSVNVFAIEGGSLGTEAEKETASTGSTTRQVLAQEDVALNDGTTMTYYALYNTEPNLTYYTYLGFIQKDTAVIKFYAVSTAENADFKNVYTELANSAVVITADTGLVEEEPTTEVIVTETGVPETTADTSAQS